MSTGFDVTAESVIAQLSETVERGASLLASEERLAGPATPQDSVSELVPGDGSTCVGVGIAFADDLSLRCHSCPTSPQSCVVGSARTR